MRPYSLFFTLVAICLIACNQAPERTTKVSAPTVIKNHALSWLDTLSHNKQIRPDTIKEISDLEDLADTSLVIDDDDSIPNLSKDYPTYFELDPKFLNISFQQSISDKTFRLVRLQFVTPGDDGDMEFIFHGPFSFSNNIFKEYEHNGRDKTDSGYHAHCTINNTVFDNYVSFSDNHYECPLDFSNTTFKDQVSFYNDDEADSLSTVIKGPEFEETIFKKGISFIGKDPQPGMDGEYLQKGITFISDLKFESCRLAGTLDLSACIFDKGSSLVLKNTNLPDTLNLSDTRFFEDLDLTRSRPDSGVRICQINLVNADIDKIKMLYQGFHVYFPNHMADSARYFDLVSGTYQNLLANFKKNGYDDSFRKLDIEFKDWQSHSDFLLSLSSLWWKYGYEKYRILLWSIMFFLFFSLVNSLIYQRLMNTYTIEELKPENYEHSSFLVPRLFQRYAISCLYTSFIFFKLSLDFEKLKVKNWSLLILLLLEYSIGLFCTGYLLNWILGK